MDSDGFSTIKLQTTIWVNMFGCFLSSILSLKKLQADYRVLYIPGGDLGISSPKQRCFKMEISAWCVDEEKSGDHHGEVPKTFVN